MKLRQLVLELFEEGKEPDEIEGLTPAKHISDIDDFVTLYFINRDIKTVSALRIYEYIKIDREKGNVISGEWETGGYNEENKTYHSTSAHPLSKISAETFVTQEKLDSKETYIEYQAVSMIRPKLQSNIVHSDAD